MYDVLFRPAELEDVTMWDQFSLYEKFRVPKGKDILDIDTDTEDDTGACKPTSPVHLFIY